MATAIHYLSLVALGLGSLFLFLVWWARGRFLARRESFPQGPLPSVSVLIAFRDEWENLPQLLDSLRAQSCTNVQYSIFLLNDHSKDGGEVWLRKQTQDDPRFQVIDVSGHGKKAALAEGIARSEGEIILTTDADCLVPPDWIERMAEPFVKPTVHVVSGLVTFLEGNLFARMQTVEFASLVGFGFASIHAGRPTMANGANFAYRRWAYQEVGGHQEEKDGASGDDEFLMHRIHQEFPGSVVTQRRSVVRTAAAPTLGAFLRQRRRWASKWERYTSRTVQLLALLVWLTQLGWLLSPLGLLGPSWLVQQVGFTWLAKLLFEGPYLFIVLRKLGHRMERPANLFAFLLVEVLYAPYVVVVGLWARFGRYSWKGRRHN